MRFICLLIGLILATGLSTAESGFQSARDQMPAGSENEKQADANLKPIAKTRRPIAIVNGPDNSILIANRDSGTVSILTPSGDAQLHYELGHEAEIGKQLSDLHRIAESDFFIATDAQSSELIGIRMTEGREENQSLQVAWRIPVCGYPTKAVPQKSETGHTVAVLGLWSRQVQFITLNDANINIQNATPPSEAWATCDLKFNPGYAVWLSTDKLLVADAFGEGLAIVTTGGETMAIELFPDHRTGGMSIDTDSKSILMTQQRLNPLARSIRNDVHWGMMINNMVREIEIEQFTANRVKPNSDIASIKTPVGGTDNAKADPGTVLRTAGSELVLIEGTNELAIKTEGQGEYEFVPVGRRPKSLALGQGRATGLAFIANSLDDTVSIIDLIARKPVQTIELRRQQEPSPVLSAAQRGERLFYDASLSHDRWMSCHSCHVDGHTNGMLNDNHSDGSFGTPKRIISLLGHADTFPLAWNGGNADYETQIKKTITTTMQAGEDPDSKKIDDLIAFLRTLPNPPSVNFSRGAKVSELQKMGKTVFSNLGCVDCHPAPHYTDGRLVEIGIEDESGLAKLNPPSLVGLSQRNRLFHDNRVTSLRGVFSQPGHQIETRLNPEEMSALLAFLQSL